jgi:DNA gyrase subunit A
MMVVSQFAKIIRIDTKSVRAAGRATMGSSLDLDADDKLAAAMVAPEDPKPTVEIVERCCDRGRSSTNVYSD